VTRKPGRPKMPTEQRRAWTLPEIKAHCLVTLNECWEWRTKPGTTPATEHSLRYVCVKHEGAVMLLRRVAYKLMYGSLPEGKKIVPAKCLNPRCNNPMHCRPLTESEKGQLAALRGSFDTPQRRRAIARGKQAATNTGMTMEKARRIRGITGPAEKHCHEFGIGKAMFNRIRGGRAWKEADGP
jgi:hypothetical protein